mmetsp:Transcript_139856/g.363562  ORF Transcript_139856/g.363562 Transcript_139856/m.363562 type:complete len:241 (+) Transcript_139856:2160-2882(+)
MDLHRPLLPGRRRRGVRGPGRRGRARLQGARQNGPGGDPGAGHVLGRGLQVPPDVHRQRLAAGELRRVLGIGARRALQVWRDYDGWQGVRHQDGPLPERLRPVQLRPVGLHGRRQRRQRRVRGPQHQDQRHGLRGLRGRGPLQRHHEPRKGLRPLPQELRLLSAEALLRDCLRFELQRPDARENARRLLRLCRVALAAPAAAAAARRRRRRNGAFRASAAAWGAHRCVAVSYSNSRRRVV